MEEKTPNKLEAFEGILKHKLSTALGVIMYLGYNYLAIRYPDKKIIIDQVIEKTINAPTSIPILLSLIPIFYKGKKS